MICVGGGRGGSNNNYGDDTISRSGCTQRNLNVRCAQTDAPMQGATSSEGRVDNYSTCLRARVRPKLVCLIKSPPPTRARTAANAAALIDGSRLNFRHATLLYVPLKIYTTQFCSAAACGARWSALAQTQSAWEILRYATSCVCV